MPMNPTLKPKADPVSNGINLAIRFVNESLPPGWEVRIKSAGGNATIRLYAPADVAGDPAACTKRTTLRDLVNFARTTAGMPPIELETD